MQEVKDMIAKYSKLLPIGNIACSFTEAEKRAGLFLEAMAEITNLRHEFSSIKIKELSTQTAVYAQELAKGTAKTMTENKVTAEASKEYTEAREALERSENDLTYLKAYYDIFQNAHIFYRNVSKGEQY